jgi:VanZ family protein
MVRAQFYILFLISLYFVVSNNDGSDIELVNDKLLHVFGFLLLYISAFFSQIFSGHRQVSLFLLSYGIFSELVQFFLPYRNFSNLDIIADLIGIICGLILVKTLNFLIKNY